MVQKHPDGPKASQTITLIPPRSPAHQVMERKRLQRAEGRIYLIRLRFIHSRINQTLVSSTGTTASNPKVIFCFQSSPGSSGSSCPAAAGRQKDWWRSLPLQINHRAQTAASAVHKAALSQVLPPITASNKLNKCRYLQSFILNNIHGAIACFFCFCVINAQKRHPATWTSFALQHIIS